jgi:uncharacterized protein YdaU (DUF1376 family)
MNYYSFHIGDYRSATAHLTNEEDLCYRRILDTYYDRDGNLPEIKLLSRKIRCEEGMVSAILSEFFEDVEGGWIHRRAQKEVDEYLERVESSRKGGKASAASRTTPTASPLQVPLKSPSSTLEVPLKSTSTPLQPTIPHYPLPNNHIPPNPPPGVGTGRDVIDFEKEASDFEQFINAYPCHRTARRTTAQRVWMEKVNQRPPIGEIMASLASHVDSEDWQREDGKFVESVDRWLEEQMWMLKRKKGKPNKAAPAAKKPLPKVDEVHARTWLADNYVGSDPSMSFEQWPPFAQKDYLAFIAGKNQPQTQAA